MVFNLYLVPVRHSLHVSSVAAQECCDVLESFFGGPMPLPEPGTSPDTIYSSLELCARTSRREKDSDEGMAKAISAATLTRLVCCRAEAATILDEPGAPQWWRTAMALYDAFFAGKPPISGLERICAFDLYRYRDN
ncbi:hypothetical protein F5Y12DRAFT_788382 [Xylaria sp. FL1777]|nr:hypothetical protein F5Y12DRAFT_788382 [Xylaria sp. FL1777]